MNFFLINQKKYFLYFKYFKKITRLHEVFYFFLIPLYSGCLVIWKLSDKKKIIIKPRFSHRLIKCRQILFYIVYIQLEGLFCCRRRSACQDNVPVRVRRGAHAGHVLGGNSDVDNNGILGPISTNPSPPSTSSQEESCKPSPRNCYRLVILGSARVGKTSIVARQVYFFYKNLEEKYFFFIWLNYLHCATNFIIKGKIANKCIFLFFYFG